MYRPTSGFLEQLSARCMDRGFARLNTTSRYIQSDRTYCVAILPYNKDVPPTIVSQYCDDSVALNDEKVPQDSFGR